MVKAKDDLCEKMRPQLEKFEMWGKLAKTCLVKEIQSEDFLNCVIEKSQELLAAK